MFKARKVLAIILMLSMVLMLSACGQQAPPPAPQSSSAPQSSAPAKEAPKEVKINVGYMPDMHGVTPLIIAEEKGFFKEEGLTVNMVKFLSGPPELQAMAAGDLDFGYIGPGATFLAAQGQCKILTIDSLNTGDMVLATKKSGIKDWSGLKGKTVGVPKGTSGEMILNLGLEKAGLKPTDLNIVSMDVAGAVAAFVADKVDAVAIWVPYTFEIEKQVGKDKIVKLGDNKDFFPEYTFPQSWVVNPKYLEKNPDVVERFMRAWTKANDYRLKNMDESVKMTAKFTQVPEDSLKVQLDTTEWMDSKKLSGYAADGTFKKWFENLEKLFVKNEKLKEVVDPAKFLSTDALMKATK